MLAVTAAVAATEASVTPTLAVLAVTSASTFAMSPSAKVPPTVKLPPPDVVVPAVVTPAKPASSALRELSIEVCRFA